MKRALLYTVAALMILIAVLLVGGRFALGALVQSEEFRARFNDVVERSLRTVLPTAMTELKGTRLTGLATLELSGLTVSNSKSVQTTLSLPTVRLSPRLLSLMGSGPLLFDGDAAFADGGHLTLDGSVPREALGERKAAVGTVTVEGAFDHIGAPAVLALLFPDKSGPRFDLTKGEATGTFSVMRPLGRHEGRHKSGQALVHLGQTDWQVRAGNEKTITLPPVDVDLALEDFVLRLKSPLTFTERTGRTTVTGSLLLPERADHPARWDLDVGVQGDTGLAGSLAKLLRCTAPAQGPRFHVEGPVVAPACPPV